MGGEIEGVIIPFFSAAGGDEILHATSNPVVLFAALLKDGSLRCKSSSALRDHSLVHCHISEVTSVEESAASLFTIEY